MKKLLESKYNNALEIIEETGKIAMSLIDDGDLGKLQDELEKLGYVSYVDESSDWLIVDDARLLIEYGRNKEKSIFAIERKVIEEIIDELDTAEIYKMTYEEAKGYSFAGTAYVVLDVTDGRIFTRWLMQNNYMMDDFGEIVLCSINTPLESLTENELLDDGELREFHNYIYDNWDEYSGIEDYIIEKYGNYSLKERKSDYIDWLSSEFELNYESIKEQLDDIYKRAYKWRM